MEKYDVIIVGGGPAGLNAASVLGRSLRKVLIFDAGHQRNRISQGIHNYLTRDHILPLEFLKIARTEIKKYGIRFIGREVVNAVKTSNSHFKVKDTKGITYYSKKLLLAPGLVDNLPPIPGFKDFYGTSIFHCPYCDAWEVRNKIIGVYARNKNGFEVAMALKTWSNKILMLSDGKKSLKPGEKEKLENENIPVISKRIERLEGKGGKLQRIVFKDGGTQTCEALFFVNGYNQKFHLIESLGCIISRQGMVLTNKLQQTNIAGLYVAGDASLDMHFVVVAAAEGAKAGVSINKELQREERRF